VRGGPDLARWPAETHSLTIPCRWQTRLAAEPTFLCDSDSGKYRTGDFCLPISNEMLDISSALVNNKIIDMCLQFLLTCKDILAIVDKKRVRISTKKATVSHVQTTSVELQIDETES
jgi:hypothetical protein